MKWWRGQDSNLRTLTRAELQSAAFNHSTTPPTKMRSDAWLKLRQQKRDFYAFCQVGILKIIDLFMSFLSSSCVRLEMSQFKYGECVLVDNKF